MYMDLQLARAIWKCGIVFVGFLWSGVILMPGAWLLATSGKADFLVWAILVAACGCNLGLSTCVVRLCWVSHRLGLPLFVLAGVGWLSCVSTMVLMDVHGVFLAYLSLTDKCRVLIVMHIIIGTTAPVILLVVRPSWETFAITTSIVAICCSDAYLMTVALRAMG